MGTSANAWILSFRLSDLLDTFFRPFSHVHPSINLVAPAPVSYITTGPHFLLGITDHQLLLGTILPAPSDLHGLS